jgi:hypothetical protein
MCRGATNLETSCKVSQRLPGPLLAFAEPMFAKLLGKKLNISVVVAWIKNKSKRRTTEMQGLRCCLVLEV